MRNLFTSKNIRNVVIGLVAAGLVFLAVSGYLTPIFSFSLSPVISGQSWLAQRYLAVRDFLTSPREMATLRQENQELRDEVSQLQGEIVALQENLSQAQILYTLLDFARSNLLEVEDGRLTGRIVPQSWGDICDGAMKRETVLRTCSLIGCSPAQAIAMGDGANDLEMMSAVGLSVAYRAKPRVREQAKVAIDMGGLDRLLEVVQPA